MNRKSKFGVVSAIAICLIAFFAFTQDVLGKKGTQTAYVDVSVITVWTGPNSLRPIDKPSATNPAQPRKWTSSMNLDQKLWLVGNLQTQAVYGAKVYILEERGDWAKVAVEGQATPKNKLGYPGWVPKVQLTKNSHLSALKSKPVAYVKEQTAFLYKDRKLQKPFMEVSFNTALPVLNQQGEKVLLATPDDGSKWINKDDVKIFNNDESIPVPTADDLIKTAKQFLGLPYLWAGVSGFGFDCSGFTSSVYAAHGIDIPRDSSVQAQHGTYIERENLKPGDLLFFAYNEGEGAVHHVGMYIGDGKMIHSPNSSSTVKISMVETSGYGDSYHSARRYLPE